MVGLPLSVPRVAASISGGRRPARRPIGAAPCARNRLLDGRHGMDSPRATDGVVVGRVGVELGGATPRATPHSPHRPHRVEQEREEEAVAAVTERDEKSEWHSEPIHDHVKLRPVATSVGWQGPTSSPFFAHPSKRNRGSRGSNRVRPNPRVSRGQPVQTRPRARRLPIA